MGYHLDFTDKANDDIAAHQKAGNKAVLNKLLTLLEELEEHPFIGTVNFNSDYHTSGKHLRDKGRGDGGDDFDM